VTPGPGRSHPPSPRPHGPVPSRRAMPSMLPLAPGDSPDAAAVLGHLSWSPPLPPGCGSPRRTRPGPPSPSPWPWRAEGRHARCCPLSADRAAGVAMHARPYWHGDRLHASRGGAPATVRPGRGSLLPGHCPPPTGPRPCAARRHTGRSLPGTGRHSPTSTAVGAGPMRRARTCRNVRRMRQGNKRPTHHPCRAGERCAHKIARRRSGLIRSRQSASGQHSNT
jgi:hypothetical protein